MKLRRNLMKTKLFLFLGIFILIGCTSSGAGRKPMRPKHFISQEEINGLAVARTAKDAIEVARPIWLRTRGIDPSIYMNGMLIGGLDQLDNISINSVKEMRYLPSAEATTMYGTNNMGGVIEIKSR